MNQSKIPKIIHQTYKNENFTKNMRDAVESWKKLNSDYEHRFYNDAAIREYISEFDVSEFNFTKEELVRCFDKLAVGAGRADLFRYCVLYNEGGVYTDIDTVCIISLNSFIEHDTDVVLLINSWFKDKMFHFFAQWFMCYCPKHLIIKNTLNLSIQSILTDTPVNILGTSSNLLERYTGPAVYNINVLEFLNMVSKKDRIEKIKECKLKINQQQIQIIHYAVNHKERLNLKDPTYTSNPKYVNMRYTCYRQEHKNDLWYNKPIFKIE